MLDSILADLDCIDNALAIAGKPLTKEDHQQNAANTIASGGGHTAKRIASGLAGDPAPLPTGARGSEATPKQAKRQVGASVSQAMDDAIIASCKSIPPSPRAIARMLMCR